MVKREFIPSLNPSKKFKKCIFVDLPDFEKELIKNIQDELLGPPIHNSCSHLFECHHGTCYERTCVRCGLVTNNHFQMRHDQEWKKEKPKFELPRVYDRHMYYKKKLSWWLETKQDIDREHAHMMQEKLLELPCPCTWKQIFDSFKTGDKKENREYAFILHFLKIKPDFVFEDEENLCKVDLFFSEFSIKYHWSIKKKFNIYYLLYKVIQMRGGKYQYVPNKLTQVTMDEYDMKWKLICDEFEWYFIPSTVVLWNWGKNQVVEEMKQQVAPIEYIPFNEEECVKRDKIVYEERMIAINRAVMWGKDRYYLYFSNQLITEELKSFAFEYQKKGKIDFELFWKIRCYYKEKWKNLKNLCT